MIKDLALLRRMAAGKDVFINFKSITNSRKRPTGNELVSCQVSTDAKGRLNATEVNYVGDFKEKSVTTGKSAHPIYFTLIYLTLMCLAVFLGTLPLFVIATHATASLLTFILYWADKRAAENGKQRTRENTLQLLSLLGGWPGGLFAQRIFRHKSTKKSFQFVYWLTVFLILLFYSLLLSHLVSAYFRRFLICERLTVRQITQERRELK